MSRWEAPRIAYEIAVEWAERVQELAVGSGGVRGQLIPVPMVGKAWHDLRTVERHDVLAALGAQARSAIWELRKHNGFADDEPLVIDMGFYSAKLCEQARETMRALTNPGGSDPWQLPQCSHCADWVATALIDIQIKTILATGIADPVAVLRMLLDSSTQVPAQRGADDDSGS